MLSVRTLPVRKLKEQQQMQKRMRRLRLKSETAKRDAQVTQAEIDRLSAETAKLNAALERLETEKTAVEGRAQTTESIAYGAIIILIALLAIVSSTLFVNRRRAIGAKREGVGPETESPFETHADRARRRTRSMTEAG